jgi:hypothetical protein
VALAVAVRLPMRFCRRRLIRREVLAERQGFGGPAFETQGVEGPGETLARVCRWRITG